MKKVSCIVMCLVIILTAGVLIVGCSDGGLPEGSYFSVSVDGGTGAGKYQSGMICTVTATVPEGRQFLKWIKNGRDASVNVEYSFNVKENSRLIAVFGDAEDQAGTEVFVVKTTNGIGNGGYLQGSECTVRVPATEEYRTFKGWAKVTDGTLGEIVSTDKVYKFTVTGDITLEALYADIKLPTPDNSDNKMFNLNAGAAVIEYDRQTDADGEIFTAFVEGVAYVKIHVYMSNEDDAQPIVSFKMVKRADGSGYLASMDETKKMDMQGKPGSYYTPDGNTHNMLKEIISTGTNGDYSTEITYYFATQAIGIPVAEGEMKYVDSDISGKGRGVKNM